MIYFDNAATTLYKPDCVVKAVAEAMCSLGNSGRGVHTGALSASRIIYDTRVALAQLFGAESPERIAFTANSTQALNIAIKGILNPGDHVVTTALERFLDASSRAKYSSSLQPMRSRYCAASVGTTALLYA